MVGIRTLMKQFEAKYPPDKGSEGGAISVMISRYDSGRLGIAGFLHYPGKLKECERFQGLAELKKLIRG